MSRRFLLLSIITAGVVTAQADDSNAFPPLVSEFFDLSCFECHNPVDKKGELDLESLKFDSSQLSDRSLLAMIHDRVRDGEMPPKEDSLVEPEERRNFLTEFEAKIHRASAIHTQELGRVKSRRLSQVEYENTLHDLFGIDIPLLEHLPEETAKNSFINIADSQQISYHLLQKYLVSIDLMLDESFKQAIEPRVTYYEEFEPHQLGVGRERIANERMAVYDADNHQLLSFPSTNGFHGRMPDTTVTETGWYRVTVTAKAHNAPPGRSVWTRLKTGILRAKAPMTYWVGHFEATDELRTHSFDTWIRAPHPVSYTHLTLPTICSV